MGLAASQARLLFITSRQSDVSAKMQRISNQNMILARDEEDVSTKYNNMLSEKVIKLKDGYSDGISLSYDAIMGKNATNASKILTVGGDSTSPNYRKVVLSSGIAKDYGITSPNGGAKEFVNTEFGKSNKAFIAHVMGKSETDVEDLLASYKAKGGNSGGEGTSTTVKLEDILNGTSKGDKATGFTMFDDNSGHNLAVLGARTNDYYGGADNLKNMKCNGSNSVGDYCNNLFQKDQYRDQFNISTSGDTGIYGIFGDGTNSSWGTNGTDTNNANARIEQHAMSLNDLYNNAGNIKGTMLLGWSKFTTDEPTLGDALSQFDNLINSIGTTVTNSLSKAGLTDPDIVDLVQTTTSNYKDSYLKNLHYNKQFYNDVSADKGYEWDDQHFEHNEDAYAAALTASTSHLPKYTDGIVAAADDKQTWIFAVDAGALVKHIIDDVIKGLVGESNIDKDYAGNKTINKSTEYTILTKYSDGVGSSGSSKSTTFTADEQRANYLDTIYDKLVNKGWIIDDTVSDSSALQAKLENGTYYVGDKPLASNDDMYEEVNKYTEKEADNYYDTEMKKIHRKEKQMDQELTKLQTEYSSLTHDYDSVKGIIDANIQKSFTYCQQG